MGSVMGCCCCWVLLRGAWRLGWVELLLLGRLRKERQADVLRHRSSGSVLRVWRYVCKPMRRDSARAGEEVVLEK